ncbi:TonB-dependent receptor [Luteimonas sp. FXH3W]|uniref:TonB-dependent receptor n=1 Tax=Aquilutibacter rugosus TaxID=3115820 RepID=A0ABU7V2K6_9GAMM
MSHSKRMHVSKLSLALVMALAAAPAFAQTTSAGLNGVIVGTDGRPVANQVVTITHTETNTSTRVTTDASGRYAASGLRVGGPYTVSTTGGSETGIYLSVSNENTVNITTAGGGTPSAVSVGTVRVSGAGRQIFNNTKMGSGTAINRRTLESLPSVGGNIQDYMRLDPRVAFVDRASGSISAGGQNPRYNSVQVDGISSSDTFGLEGNNMATRRQPVSMDAIEAMNVEVSSYDAQITGATGAVVNAVTKSGTNNFHGSLYGNFRDGDWFGKDPLDKDFKGFTKEYTYGATLGGPLVKDKLFFFVNYEKFHQGAPGADLSSTALGKTNATITTDMLTRAATIAQSKWGIDAGTLESTGDMDLEEYAAKIDWNVNDNHRASFRYSHLDQSKLRINGMGSNSVSLSSYWYQHDKSIDTYVGQLFSDWTDTFSTEAKVSYRDYAAIRNIPTNAPSVQIYNVASTATALSGDSIWLGTETNSQANQLFTKTWNANLTGKWDLGEHKIKAGIDFSSNDIYNIYAPQIFGLYTFRNLNDFEAGKWYTYNLRTPKPGPSVDDMAAKYKYNSLGFYAMDTWSVTPNLTVNYGFRYDKADVNTKPTYNATAQTAFGLDNSNVPMSGLFQPRFGFNYRLETELPSQIRGGIGLFSGDAPQVWLSNSYNTTGLNYVQYTQTTYNPALPFNGDGTKQSVPASATNALQNVNFVSPDFKQPAVWKANLAFETTLPWYGIIGSTELLMTKVKSALIYKNLNLGQPVYQGPDGRDMFWGTGANCTAQLSGWGSSSNRCLRNRSFDTVYLLDSTDKGYSNQMTFSLNKPFSSKSDWSWYAGYTYTDAKEVSGLTSSTASSGWNYNYLFDANEEVLSTARYEIKHRFTGQLNWRHKLFGDYNTSVGVVYEGRTGRPFSYVYFNDVNGDTRTFNDLFYVPAAPGDVKFGAITGGKYVANAAMETAFFQWLDGEKDLAKWKGRYAPQNSGRAGFVHTFDVRISQELPGLFKGHKSEIWLDIQNIGNLLNKDWGHIMDYGFFANTGVASIVGIDGGKYVYNFTSPQAPSPANADADGFNVGVSQWSAQAGFRYKF